MASFFITGSSTTAQTLAAGQNGFVATNATLYTETATAVTITGAASLAVMGTVATAEASAAVRTSGTVAAFQMTVGAQGTVLSTTTDAIRLSVAGDMELTNAGTISGGTGVYVDGNATFGTATIQNSGTILSNRADAFSGVAAIYLDTQVDDGYITNSGRIQALDQTYAIVVKCVLGTTIVNTGEILGSSFAIFSDTDLTLHNTGTIVGKIDVNADLLLHNTGTIVGPITSESSSATTVLNSGLIDGDVYLGGGGSTFRNNGGFVTGAIVGGTGNDTYIIDRTDLRLRDEGGSADHVVTFVDLKMPAWAEELSAAGLLGLELRGRRFDDSIFGGGGDDTIIGGAGNDFISTPENQDSGDDVLYGGVGDDSIFGGDGDDLIFGGDGNDLVTLSNNYGSAFRPVVNGDAGDDTLRWFGGSGSFNGGAGTDRLNVEVPGAAAVDLTLGTATVFALGQGGPADVLTLTSVEHARGDTGNDSLTGSNAANLLDGQAGNDSILGLNGNDTLLGGNGNDTIDGGGHNDVIDGGANNDSLFGGSGNDTLYGGLGRDTMDGGAGFDVFAFRTVTESAVLAPDLIVNFDTLRDVIDLEEIYGDPNAPVDVPFTFLGTGAFTGEGPEVNYTTAAGNTLVQIRLADSTSNDAVIVLQGLFTLTADHFVL
jgi:hypothetical protein